MKVSIMMHIVMSWKKCFVQLYLVYFLLEVCP